MSKGADIAYHFLHLEDDPRDAELVESILNEAGIRNQTLVVKSREEFVNAVDCGEFDLILSDFKVPSFSGNEALAFVLGKRMRTPFIFVSGTVGEDAAIESLLRGATDYVLKTKLARLAPAVRRALQEAREGKKLADLESKRQRALHDLQASEARFRGFLESAPDAVIITNAKREITFANPGVEKVFSYLRDELIGQPISVLVPERFRRTHNEFVSAFNNNPHARSLGSGLELFGRRKDGSEFPADIMLSPLTMENEASVLAMIRDTTAAKDAERALQISEDKYRSLVEGVSDAIFSLSMNGVVQSLNLPFETMTGWRRDEWLGKSFTDLLHREDRPKAASLFRRLIRRKPVEVSLFRIAKKEGGYLILEFNTTLQMRDGRMIGILGVARDVTAQRMLEEKLRQSQKLESIGTLAGGIAHDFNNILGIIVGYTGLIKMSVGDDVNLVRSVDAIEVAAKRGIEVVRQLLTFARKEERVAQSVDVNDVVADTFKLILETFPKSISISAALSERKLTMVGDPTELHQAILNLCVNARDAMISRTDHKLSGGKLEIATGIVKGDVLRRKFPQAGYDEYVEVRVSDTGSGMDEATISRIFEPFFTTKERGKGTGLGLAKVYGIVQGHAGFVDVSSKISEGTVFSLFLPFRYARDFSLKEEDSKDEELRGGNETVLIVEDELSLLEFLEEVLKNKGYKVLSAGDGQRAVSVFFENRDIRLVLSDIGLPNLDGIELLHVVKESDPQVRVILAGGFIEEDQKERAANSGIDAFLQKPYELNDVLRIIRKVLDAE